MLLILLATACNNACQDLCKEMVAYAEECDFTVPDDQPGACIAENGRRDMRKNPMDFGAGPLSPKDQIQVCEENIDNLREEWSCEDVGKVLQAQ